MRGRIPGNARPGLRARWLTAVVSGLVAGSLALAPNAIAATPSAAWSIASLSEPTNFAPGDSSGHDQYVITATNTGGAAESANTSVTLTDTLPTGVTLDAAGPSGFDSSGNTVTCTATPTITCTDEQNVRPLVPQTSVTMVVPVDVSPTAPATVTNHVAVSSGTAPGATGSEATTISASEAPFEPQTVDETVTNSDGSPDIQAGSHPFAMTTSFQFTSALTAQGQVRPEGNPKDITVDLPPGFVGDPSATPTCTIAQLDVFACPADSQVGVIVLTYGGSEGQLDSAVYNVEPSPGEPARFGFFTAAGSQQINIGVRTGGDYGLTATMTNVLQASPFLGASLTLWGVPSDPSHDSERCAFPAFGCSSTPFAGTPAPFLTLPTSCDGPQATTVTADSWQDPGSFTSASVVSHDNSGAPEGLTGCGALPFDPTMTTQPDVTTADSPTGLAVNLSLPQDESTTGLAEAELKTATIALPEGLSVSPSAADGLGACTMAEIGLDNGNTPTCPDASKIGTVQIETPVLPNALTGSVYLAQQDANPFGSLLAIYVAAQDPVSGVSVKLAGRVFADPVTGQLTTTFSNTPQLPFSDFKLDFFGGPQAVLATPEGCGTYTTTSSLTPWTGEPASNSSDSFTINSGCVSGFSPSFTAGTQNPQAGAFSPFVLSFARSDTDQELSGLSLTLPDGVLAKLAGVQECSDQQLAAAAAASGTAEQGRPSCPAGSQVGTVEVGAGAGSNPFFLPGKVYLTGPYEGGPYGLAVVVPAVAGPFDLGTVVVRQAIHIDPETAQVSVTSDRFPTILQGIPLRIRRIDVNLDRPDFTVNSTSCNPSAVMATLTSTGGLSENVRSRYQVGGCQDIGFSPKLKIALTGKGKTRSGDHPTLTATLTPRSGQANIKTARVALPLSLALDPNNSNNVCPYATAQAVHGGAVGCPASTIVGSASVVTPLLSEPLTGKVYLVQGIRFGKNRQQIRTLPSLLIPLRGQIALDLRAQTSVSGGKLVTTFSSIPDAPVSTFTLKLNGGKKGILVITGRGRSICTAKQVGNADLGAQSGKTTTKNMTLSTPCGTPAQLKVLSHSVKGRSVSLAVRTSERGRLTVTGRGLKGFSRTLSAGTHQIRVAVKAVARKVSSGSRSKQRQTTKKVKVHVQLTPPNAMPATATFTVRT